MVYKEKLDNGLTVVVDQNLDSKLVTLKYVVNAGSYDEKNMKRGIFHFLEHMMFKGTHKRTAEDINNDIAFIGGQTNAYTSYDIVGFYINVPAENWKAALEILNDIMWDSLISPEEVAKEKTVILEEIKMYDDDPQEKCMEQLAELVTPEDNRKRIQGTIDTVSSIQSEDIIDVMKKFIQPGNMALIVSGNIQVDELIDNLKDVENIPGTVLEDRTISYTKEVYNNRLIVKEKNDIVQSHFGFMLGGTKDEDERLIQIVVAKLLGGGFASRLYKIIREQKGYAYTVSVYVNELRDVSHMIGYCGLEGKNIEEVHKIVVKELNRLKYELVSDNELELIKSLIKGSLLLDSESTYSKTIIPESNFINNMDNTLEDEIEGIENVTSEDIMNYAKKFFTKDNICFSIVRPMKGR